MAELEPMAAALAQAREQLRHTIERLDEARADLEATAAGLRLPEHEEDIGGPIAADPIRVKGNTHDKLP